MNDADHVRNLLGRYAERIDAGDFEGVGALFARGALAGADGPPFASGATAVATFYASGTQLHGGSPRTKHLVSGTVLEPPSPDGTRTVRSSYLVLQATDGQPLQPIITGRYVDTFARSGDDTDHERDGGWFFLLRRFHVDLVGDLSRHLVQPDLAGPPVPSDG
ncbi:MAG: nuclear transport factor 2 family protein [Acidimicrobiales bacterium]|nr:nuclear transport factor 2 family protein [Actinomycetota bacterium]